MSRNFILYNLALFFYITFPINSFGCSVVTVPPTAFDTLEYVFIGEVIDVVGPLEARLVVGQAWGLLLKVRERVFLPETPQSFFELYFYNHGQGCEPWGIHREHLTDWVGAEVAVVARESEVFKSKPHNGNIRLEISLRNEGSIFRSNYPDKKIFTSATSVYDYNNPSDKGPYSLINFELRKDLLRLESADSQAEKVRVLRRLMGVREYYTGEYNYKKYLDMIKNHIKNQNIVEMLIKEAAEVNKGFMKSSNKSAINLLEENP